MSDAVYKLEDLARAAGTTARTVRYYVQRGLIPAPAFRGKDTAYGHEHLVRLRAIRRLQEAFFPLDAIALELDRRSLTEIEHIADGKELPATELLTNLEREARQMPPPQPSVRGERLFRRIELAPGVELSVAENAPPESRRIVEALLSAMDEQMKRAAWRGERGEEQ